MPSDPDHLHATESSAYTDRLVSLKSVWWRRLLNVQAPYMWNLHRLEPGYVLDIGCGIGRNLGHLKGHGIGVDHNAHSVAVCRQLGLKAYTPEEFRQSPEFRPERFDSLLVSHVLEHMTEGEAAALLREHLPLIKRGGKVILITPQEKGYRTDATHVEFVDFTTMRRLAASLGLTVARAFSFPFPRLVGHLFPYNEFVVILALP